MTSGVSRRAFLQSAAMVPAAFGLQRKPPLTDQFSDLRRHFVFEYYPWYRTDPWEHWPEASSNPPATFGSKYLPALGLYATREGILAQASVILLLALSALWTALRRDREGDGSAGRPAAAAA